MSANSLLCSGCPSMNSAGAAVSRSMLLMHTASLRAQVRPVRQLSLYVNAVCCLQTAEAHPDMAVAELAAIYIGLARFASAVYPDNLQHTDAVLAACAEVRRRLIWCHSASERFRTI